MDLCRVSARRAGGNRRARRLPRESSRRATGVCPAGRCGGRNRRAETADDRNGGGAAVGRSGRGCGCSLGRATKARGTRSRLRKARLPRRRDKAGFQSILPAGFRNSIALIGGHPISRLDTTPPSNHIIVTGNGSYSGRGTAENIWITMRDGVNTPPPNGGGFLKARVLTLPAWDNKVVIAYIPPLLSHR